MVSLNLCKEFLNLATFIIQILLRIKSWTFWYMKHVSMSSYKEVIDFYIWSSCLVHSVYCTEVQLYVSRFLYATFIQRLYLMPLVEIDPVGTSSQCTGWLKKSKLLTIFVFSVSQGSVEALIRWGGKI